MANTSSTSSALNSLFGNKAVMGGMMSGLDTENLVKAATMVTKSRINSQKQKLQTLTWKQDAYRGVISKLSDFQSKYLDILSPTSIRANAVMNKYKAESTNDKLKASASSNAATAKYEITYSRKATAAKIEGGRINDGVVNLNFRDAKEDTNTVEITLDGNTRAVTFKGGANVKQNFIEAVNKEFSGVSSAQFVLEDSPESPYSATLKLSPQSGDKVTHNFEVAYNDAVGLKNTAYSRVTKQSAISDVSFATPLSGSKFEFSINGVNFSFSKDDKLQDVMDKVNKSDAGVTMSFNTLSQSFTLQTNKTGAGQKIDISQTKGNLIDALFNTNDASVGVTPSRAFVDEVPRNTQKISVSEDDLPVAGYSSDKTMELTINGVNCRLDLSKLTQKQDTHKLDHNGSEVEAKVYTNSSNSKIYAYDEGNGTIAYYDENNELIGEFTDDGSGTYTFKEKDGTIRSDTDKDNLLSPYDLNTLNEVYEKKDYEAELNNALEKAVNTAARDAATLKSAKEKGYDEAADGDLEAWINDHFTSADKEVFNLLVDQRTSEEAQLIKGDLEFKTVTDSATGKKSIVLDGTASSVTLTNANEFNAETEDMSFTDKIRKDPETTAVTNLTSLTFQTSRGDQIIINGTGEDGKVTIKDLTDYRDHNGRAVFTYGSDGVINVTAGNVLESYNDDTKNFAISTFGSSTLKGTTRGADMTVYGTNAQVTINGVTLENADSTFTVDGTTMTFDDVADFDASLEPEKTITVNTQKDNSAIVETVKNFIEDYNTLITDLYKTINTARPKDSKSYYDPLTEEQEEEMTEDEIKDWNEKAKEGWLYNDPTVSKVINSLRSTMSKTFEGMNLASMGINIKLIRDGGSATDPKLYIDEGKLESAVNQWGEEIAKFFTDSENGLAVRLNKAIDDAISTRTSDGAGGRKTYGYLTNLVGVADTVSEKKNQYYNQMQSIQKMIDKLQERYKAEQKRYWDKFTALETYISDMSSQMSAFETN